MTGTIATVNGGKQVERKLNVRRDTLDFRDRMFEATLIEVPTHIPLAAWRKWRVPVLDQGEEGACTGFGLATVANYLLSRRKVVPDSEPVSARMLYEMARRYDEWPGESYSGSSARGAMKGWHKHGVCREDGWPYQPERQGSQRPDAGPHGGRRAQAAGRLPAREPPRPGGHAQRPGRSGRAVRLGHRPSGLGAGGPQGRDSLPGAVVGRPRLRHRRLRQRGLLDPELLGRQVGHGRVCAHLL